jgi:thiamine pyrophosphokinase
MKEKIMVDSSNHGTDKALIVANGVIRDYNLTLRRIKKDYGFEKNVVVIAADGGIRHCINMHLFPDIIIGDMDSINIKLMERLDKNTGEIKFINSSSEKDESDTQLAVDYLLKRKIKKIIIIGALGDRIDHSFANLVLLASPSYKNIDIKILDENNETTVTQNSTVIRGKKGKSISIFSLSPSTHFISTGGLKYKLKDEKLLFSPVRGLSNVFTKDTADIKIKRGKLLIVKEL